MALPTTNLSLNAIHVEVGGTSGTQVSLNDADVRAIGNPDPTYAGSDGINTTSGSQISIGEFRNASAGDQVSFTVDADGASYTYYTYYGGATGNSGYAYHGSPTFSASDTFDLISGSPQFFDITEYISYNVDYPPFGGSDTVTYDYRYVQFALVGTHSNAGWTSMAIGNTTYNRTDADSFLTYTSGGTAVTAWRWNTNATADRNGTVNFPVADWVSAGSTQTVYFT
jgi:hypothetical protein